VLCSCLSCPPHLSLLGTMAAVCEPAALSVTAHGVAFEVDFKNPAAAEVMTPVRARLEKEAASGRLLPCLLRSSCDTTSPGGSSESPRKEGIAERVRARNEKKQAAAQRARKDYEEHIDLKRTSLERDLERATQSRQTSLADKSSKAGKHFEDVKAKVGDVQLQHATAIAERQRRLEETLAQRVAAHLAGVAERGAKAGKHCEEVKAKVDDVQRRQADDAAEQQRRLEETLAQKGAAHLAGVAERGAKAGKHFEDVKAKVGDVQLQHATATAERQRRLEETLAQKGAAHSTGVAERSTKAGQHNGRVAEKVQKHQEEVQRRLELLREQQQAAQQKADELREQLRCKGSTKGATDHLVSAPVSPSGSSGGAAAADGSFCVCQ